MQITGFMLKVRFLSKNFPSARKALGESDEKASNFLTAIVRSITASASVAEAKKGEPTFTDMLESVDAAVEQLMRGVGELPSSTFVDCERMDQHSSTSE